MRLTERLTARHGALLVVDMQEKLLAAMPEREPVIENVVRLVRGARELEIPVWGTEQYPRGLGPTVPRDRRVDPRAAHQAHLPVLCRAAAPGAALRPAHPPPDGRRRRGPRLRGPDRARAARPGLPRPGPRRRRGLAQRARLGVRPSPAGERRGRRSRRPRPSCSNGSRRPTGRSSRRSAKWSRRPGRPARPDRLAMRESGLTLDRIGNSPRPGGRRVLGIPREPVFPSQAPGPISGSCPDPGGSSRDGG